MSIMEQYNNELYHYGVKGMKWGVRKADYRAMSRSQRKQTRNQYKLNKIDRNAEKRVEKHGLKGANAISKGKGAVATVLKSGLGTTGLFAASKLYTATNAMGLMANVYAGSAATAATAASLTTAATMTGIATIPMAAIGAYGLYSAGKSIYRTGQNTSANRYAAEKKSN